MEKSSESRLSVIIVNYNSLRYLKDCIASIRQYNDIGDRLEVIVVDNSTNAESREWLQTQTDIRWTANENKGFGQGNNTGAKLAGGDYLLFLNPDTLLIEPVFQYAIDRFASDERLGLFGVRLVDAEGAPNTTYGLRMPLGLARTMLSRVLIRLRIFIPSVMYTSGADIFIRRSVFEQAGGFDEAIFMYCEEADLCNRVNRAGYANAYDPRRRIVHLEGKTQESNLFTYYRRQMEARRYYCEKYRIDFPRFLRKERRYCALKAKLFRLRGNAPRAQEYEKIVELLDSMKET